MRKHKDYGTDKALRFPIRARDLAFALVLVYAVVPPLLPSLSKASTISLLFLHALAWRGFHSVALGLALKKQSERRWIVRHFLKHYHYERDGDVSFRPCFCDLPDVRLSTAPDWNSGARRPFGTPLTTGRRSTTCRSA